MTEIKHRGKALLFLSSFTPLWLIFFGNFVIKNGFILLNYPINDLKTFSFEFGFLIVFIVSVISTIFFLIEFRKTGNPKKIIVSDRENVTGEYVLYVVTYIIPFLVSDFGNEEVFTLSVMLFFVGILYVRADLIHINPMFAIFGYRLYTITDENSNKIYILAKRTLYRDDEVYMNRIDTGFFIEVNPPN